MHNTNRSTHPGGASVLDSLEPRLLLAASLFKNITTTVPSSDDGLIVAGDVAYFVRGEHENQTLFRTDATRGGTTSLKRLLPKGHELQGFFATSGNDLFFFSHAVTGYTLWKLSPDDAAAAPVKRFASYKTPFGLAEAGGKLFFRLFAPQVGETLWVSDTTRTGTRPVRTATARRLFAAPEMISFNGELYLSARAQKDPAGQELWATDGTRANTRLVRDIFPGHEFSNPNSFVVAGDRLLFSATDASGHQFWSTDGTTANTRPLPPGTDIDDLLGSDDDDDARYFARYEPDTGYELWHGDGTPEGSRLVRDIAPGTDGSFGTILGSFRDNLLFIADDGAGHALWKTSGSANTTKRLKRLNEGDLGSNVNAITVVNGALYFGASHSAASYNLFRNLWTSDGTPEGTRQVRTLDTGVSRIIPAGDGGLMFIETYTRRNKNRTYQLYASDGTADNTRLLLEGPIERFAVLDGRLYFQRSGALWTSDGTPEGTRAITSFPTAGDDASHVSNLTLHDGSLHFTLATPTGRELWTSDGTPAGTGRSTRLFDQANVSVSSIVPLGDRLILLGRVGDDGSAVWASDGRTPAVLLEEFGSTWGGSMTVFRGELYFGAGEVHENIELWKTDGTPSGTRKLKDINPDGASHPSDFTPVGDTLFFAANDGRHSWELWKTDGSEAGTVLVKDITSPNNGIPPRALTAVGDKLVFSAFDDEGDGVEPWVTDGTPEGTRQLADINPGPASSNSGLFTVFGNQLIFVADDGRHGQELWHVPLSDV